MALTITGYVDPGTYLIQQIVPTTVSVTTVPLTVCLIGTATRTKNVSNEAVTHGSVVGEALTVASTPGAHNATLAHVSNRNTGQLTVFANGTPLTSGVSFLPASVVGTGAGPYNFTTNNLFSLAMDGNAPVTFQVTTGGSTTVTVTGSLIAVQLTGITISAVTNTNLVLAINTGLGNAAAAALGYGPAYAAVASLTGGDVTLTSPNSTSASDVRLYTAYPSGLDETAAIFGTSQPFEAPTVVQLTNTVYSGSATYTANYVSTVIASDPLSKTPVVDIVKAGLFAGVTSFVQGVDYTLSGNNISFSGQTAAVFTPSAPSATYNISVNNLIILALDGRASIQIQLTGLSSPPPGYANAGTPTAALASEIANNINAVLAASSVYGPPYRGVAAAVGTAVVLTSPVTGVASLLEFVAPPSLSAVTTVFGLTSGQLPFSVNGSGSTPVAGALYFVTYDYTRPTGDYNLPKQYFTTDTWYADFGTPAVGNQLALAGQIAFNNDAPSVIGIQVNDATVPGSPTTTEVINAIAASVNSSAATEIVVLDTRLVVQTNLVQNIVNENSPTQAAYRRGWFGMPVGTQLGDRTTPGTFIYESTQTLQVPADSPARGRLILVAPTGVNYIFNDTAGVSHTVNLDSTFVAAAIAGLMSSFSSVAATLANQTIIGFDPNTFPVYTKAQRALLASNGTTVVTLKAGNLVMLDPQTTEAGGGGLVEFEQIPSSTQKDAVSTAVSNTVDNNLVGIVPQDLSLFLATVKGFVGGALRSLVSTGAIAPYKNANGTTRDINLATDVQVYQDPTNPTSYQFAYTFNLRFAALRFFGVYTVDSPF